VQPSPSTPSGWLALKVSVLLERARAGHERGASTNEWMIVAAVLVVVAAVLAVIIYNLVTDPGGSVEPPPPPGGI
jgi:hypothetical protein